MAVHKNNICLRFKCSENTVVQLNKFKYIDLSQATQYEVFLLFIELFLHISLDVIFSSNLISTDKNMYLNMYPL